jgi:DNA invertase Pin-like site-specific DNA recombinase
MPTKRAALYLRVSSLDQHPETQLYDLQQLAAQRGYEVVKQYTDRISGAKARRPALDELLADARRRKFNVVVVWAFDRMARSVRHFLEVLDELNQLNIEFVSHRENIDTGGALGRAMIVIVGAIAELERSLITERVRAGMRRARLEGTILGRKPLDVDRTAIVSDRLTMSLTEVRKKHGVSRGTVVRLVKLARIADSQAGILPPSVHDTQNLVLSA